MTIATRRGVGDAYIATTETGFDAQGREVYAKQEQPGGGYAFRVRQYDARGQLARESIPGACCAAPSYWATYEYDVLGRMVALQRPTSQSDPAPAVTRWRYDGLSVTRTDALGRSTTRQFDVAGNVVRVIDPGAADTDYEYDAFGSLAKVRDFYGTETSGVHDVRGFRTSLSDPDTGVSTYTYFPAGEVKTQTNARGQVTSFTYDRLSRPIQRKEPVLLLAAPGLIGCGYQVKSSTRSLPAGIQSLGIPTFKNASSQFKVEQRISGAVLKEFLTRTKIRVNSDSSKVDAVLVGEIGSVSASPVAFGADGFASTFLVTVQMRVKLVKASDSAVLWENNNFLFRERYLLNRVVKDFFSEENPALDRLAHDFAASLVSIILSR